MSSILSQPLTYILGFLFVLALVSFIFSMQQLRVARHNKYWRLRRAAGQRGGQLFLMSVTLFIIVGVVWSLSGLAELALGDNIRAEQTQISLNASYTPSHTPNLDETIAALLTQTAIHQPTQTPIPPSATPIIPTETLAPSSTPIPLTATFTPEFVLSLTPPTSNPPPRVNANLSVENIQSDMQSPAAIRFPAGIRRLYVNIRYSALDDDITWSRILYRNNTPIQGGAYKWVEDESGTTQFFFGNERGYPAGDYEVRLYIGEIVVNQYEFTIVNGD